ncbi:hypothetical protein M9H77_20768 [Catharanthus roseus]|uniref:Uncharacterized protein n=1 Tax=Catharanthus roseus TaxID=4058 RepID=A0ACC0AMF2_CATRO|nr:hypothetical protein M9H77_20768 [Catharanthus roseus]
MKVSRTVLNERKKWGILFSTLNSPTPIVAFLFVTSKVAASALATQIFNILFYFSSNEWDLLLDILAILSMILGNLIAIIQSSMKRMFAYSSIGQIRNDASAAYITALPLDTYRNNKLLVSPRLSLEFSKLLWLHPCRGKEPVAILNVLRTRRYLDCATGGSREVEIREHSSWRSRRRFSILNVSNSKPNMKLWFHSALL